jgi:hypothetical protein
MPRFNPQEETAAFPAFRDLQAPAHQLGSYEVQPRSGGGHGVHVKLLHGEA